MDGIAFDGSRWVGVIAEDFTFTAVRAICQALGETLRATEPRAGERGVVVGYDTRFLSEAFAAQAARVLSAQRIPVFLGDREAPTPAVAAEVLRRRAAAGVVVTAGEASADHNGIRLVGAWGGGMPAETAAAVETRANRLLQQGHRLPALPPGEAEQCGLIARIDLRGPYLDRLRALLGVETLREARPRVVVDPMHGAAQGYLDALLRETGCDVTVIHGGRDPHFGGRPPDPAAHRLGDLAFQVVETSAHLGVATDAEGERFGLIDADGMFLEPNAFLGLLLRHLAGTRGWTGGAARSTSTSHLVDAVARQLGIPLFETSADFQEIGRLVARDAVVLGGDEGGRLSVKGHLPGPDGILACLLAAEMVASRGRVRLRAMLQELSGEVGTFLTRRLTLPVEAVASEQVAERLAQSPGRLAGLAVIAVTRQDGWKILLEDGSWLLLDCAGKEPGVRLYAEAGTAEQLERLVTAGEALLR